ncbi:DUF1648 domain-containing protein [Corynebacterium sp. MC3]|uniref:DUF1648 domain-containing protein n=1 Tax=Corynebacterium sp. MC3 TaxID=1720193 RepID=UPI0008D9A52B|nr:DUF1648 domain-containing protein [Corynebacterium sp. MC3]
MGAPVNWKPWGVAAIVLLAHVALLLLYWDSIPDPIAVHFDAAGQADSWEPKTPRHVLMMPLYSAGTALLMLACLPPRGLAQPQPVPGSPSVPYSVSVAQRVEQVVHLTWRFLGWFAVAVAVAFLVSDVTTRLPAFAHMQWLAPAVWVAFTILVVVGSLVLMVRLTSSKKVEPDAEEIARADDEFFLGVYNAPSDPMAAISVPSRPTRLIINRGQQLGKRYLVRMLAAVVVYTLFTVLVAML